MTCEPLSRSQRARSSPACLPERWRLALLVGPITTLILACSGEPYDETDTSDLGVASSSIRKPGGAIGDHNYCDDPRFPCALGEGDCDRHYQCAVGLVCGRSALAKYGASAGDACVPAHCINNKRDVDETQIDCGGECGTHCPPLCNRALGSSSRCSSDCICGLGEGDCDSNAQCSTGLVCGRGLQPQFGGPPGDACVPAHCINERSDADETGIDCGGECGDAKCVNPGCAPGYIYSISITGNSREQWAASPDELGACMGYSRSYRTVLTATVMQGAVKLEGYRFGGTYPITTRVPDGFSAKINTAPSGCDRVGLDNTGFLVMDFNCGSHTVKFQAKCQSDIDHDGCYPNLLETASGVGSRTH